MGGKSGSGLERSEEDQEIGMSSIGSNPGISSVMASTSSGTEYIDQ
ncbi:hypothetical protein BQ8420_17075 [Nocardiopsis sp. JB363]|nr:hypothetical protein BQ8420_17075 [Nocardiopsis sp. JB363]